MNKIGDIFQRLVRKLWPGPSEFDPRGPWLKQVDEDAFVLGGGQRRDPTRLSRIFVLTNDKGPFTDDTFWHFEHPDGDFYYPSSRDGGELLAFLQQLEGFDNEAVIAAMGSVTNNRFLAWDRAAVLDRFEIVPAIASDVPAMLEIRLAVSENSTSQARLDELGISASSIRAMLASSHGGYCAKRAGQTVGFALTDRRDGSVFALFVRPEHEGQGAGNRLLDAAVDDLRRAGHQRLTLRTEPGTRAHAFYLAQGWQSTGVAHDNDVELALNTPKSAAPTPVGK